MGANNSSVDKRYNYGHTLIMKTAISLDDALFENAEHLAQKMHVTRSYLYALALKVFIEKHQNDSVTEELDELYSKVDSKTDLFLRRTNQMLLRNEEW